MEEQESQHVELVSESKMFVLHEPSYVRPMRTKQFRDNHFSSDEPKAMVKLCRDILKEPGRTPILCRALRLEQSYRMITNDVEAAHRSGKSGSGLDDLGFEE